MVCHCSVPNGSPQSTTRVLHPAKAMTPPQRRQLALEALAGTETASTLAGQYEVSRKFVYRQAAQAKEALDVAFSPADRDDQKVREGTSGGNKGKHVSGDSYRPGALRAG